MAIAPRRYPRMVAVIGSIILHTAAAPPIGTVQPPTGLVVQLEVILSQTARRVLAGNWVSKGEILPAVEREEARGSVTELAAEGLGTDPVADQTVLVVAISPAAVAETETLLGEGPVDTADQTLVPGAAEDHQACDLRVAGEVAEPAEVSVAAVAADADRGNE